MTNKPKNKPMHFLDDAAFVRWMAVCDKRKKKSSDLFEELTAKFSKKKLVAKKYALTKEIVLSYINTTLTSDEFEDYKRRTRSAKTNSVHSEVAPLQEARLQEAPLEVARLEKAPLQEARLQEAPLEVARLEKAPLKSSTVFENSLDKLASYIKDKNRNSDEISAVKLGEISKIILLSKKDDFESSNEKVKEISKILSLNKKEEVATVNEKVKEISKILSLNKKEEVATVNEKVKEISDVISANNEVAEKFRFIEKFIGGSMKEEYR
jgi:hypothetical protein